MSRLDEVYKEHPIEDEGAHARDSIHINGADLRSELERIPSDLAHYGYQFARAHRRMITAKVNVEEVKAAAYLEQREILNDLGGKVTEAVIDAHTVNTKEVREARALHIEAEYEREQLRAHCDALRAKRDSLQSLVNLARAEMSGTGVYREPAQES